MVNALDNTSVLLAQDWAMKFLSRKFRESETNWFVKRGISWHLTVAIRIGDDHKLQMMTFVNVFRSCSQDSCTVLSVMSDVVKQLREAQPQLENIYYWQDNAGCYRCGTTIVGAKLNSQQHGVSVRRMPFLWFTGRHWRLWQESGNYQVAYEDFSQFREQYWECRRNEECHSLIGWSTIR